MATQTLILLFLITFLSSQSLHVSTAQSIKAAYWFPESGFPVSSINATLFTHLFCAFADLNATTNRVSIASSKAAAFSSFTSTVRQKNPSVITLLSIGGGSSNSSTFSSMASQPSSRKTFIDSSITIARANNFSGLDIDWEFPQTATDMRNLGILISEWRNATYAEAQRSGKIALLLACAVSATPTLNSPLYPVPSMKTSMDFVNIMAYDFYAPTWYLRTSAHAALKDPSGGVSGSSGIDAWINAGLPANKMVFGLPYYGYAWKLSNQANHGLGAAATGPATGTGIDIDGSIAFNQIKAFNQRTGAATVYNGSLVVDYCYSGTTWIGYDDVSSVAAKVSYAKQKGLRGYFAWSVGGDDNWVLSRRASTTWG
ncbi:hypothetical protein J5N97_002659 [Dioscorea zingiberensis]|uniref:GH18 domain-containing protein n=1 Tax=Dioscorea zingiberensis TaxID=325984 RepID=A0A9D5HPP0_9LILI|nr:hypothetical protein J5N97_002659 [Dioscorea zingiberensis]